MITPPKPAEDAFGAIGEIGRDYLTMVADGVQQAQLEQEIAQTHGIATRSVMRLVRPRVGEAFGTVARGVAWWLTRSQDLTMTEDVIAKAALKLGPGQTAVMNALASDDPSAALAQLPRGNTSKRIREVAEKFGYPSVSHRHATDVVGAIGVIARDWSYDTTQVPHAHIRIALTAIDPDVLDTVALHTRNYARSEVTEELGIGTKRVVDNLRDAEKAVGATGPVDLMVNYGWATFQHAERVGLANLYLTRTTETVREAATQVAADPQRKPSATAQRYLTRAVDKIDPPGFGTGQRKFAIPGLLSVITQKVDEWSITPGATAYEQQGGEPYVDAPRAVHRTVYAQQLAASNREILEQLADGQAPQVIAAQSPGRPGDTVAVLRQLEIDLGAPMDSVYLSAAAHIALES